MKQVHLRLLALLSPYQVSIAFHDTHTNAGDLPLMSAVSSDDETIQVEVVESVKGSAPFVNEVQRITLITSTVDDPSGTFTIVVGASQTSPLALNVSDADLAFALEQLPGIRSSINVTSSGFADLSSWTVTFMSPGPQTLLASPCEENLDSDEASQDCLLENASVQIRRVARGRLPAEGTFRLRLVPADGSAANAHVADVRTTAPLPLDATAAEVQSAMVLLVGGRNTIVTVAPNPRGEYGFDWGLTLHDNGASSVELVDVNIHDPGPWCVDGVTGPAEAETYCEFPFTVGEDGGDTHFTCAGVVGSGLGWCSTISTFDQSRDWGGCMRCAEGAPTGSATIHVASLRRGFRLRGGGSQVSQALSEVVYYPRPSWNAWLGGHDEVSAYWYDENSVAGSEPLSGARARSISRVFVAPVNDPPTISIDEQNRLAYESEELLLGDAKVTDPDLATRPQTSIRIELEAGLGTLAFGDTSGLTFVSGSLEPHSSQRLVVTGSLDTIQNAMRQVYYRPLSAFAPGSVSASMRTTLEVQRVELVAPLLPMVQSVTTSVVKGYAEGDFTISANCSTFFEEVDGFFAAYVDLVNEDSVTSFTSVVESPAISADAPATGDGSMETEIRDILSSCVGLAWDRADLLAELASAALSSSSEDDILAAEGFAEEMLSHRDATAVVSRGEPDLHGSLRWMITLIDVPQSFPAFEVSSNDLTGAGEGLGESPYAFDGDTTTSESPAISIEIVQTPSPLTGANGTFTLKAASGGVATAPIPTSASGDEVAAALVSLADVGAVQVSSGPIVISPPATPAVGQYWEVTFLQSGSPVQIGDQSPLEAEVVEIEGEGALLRVSEVVKGRSLNDSVTILVNDLGNVGEGGALEAAAAWNVVVIPRDVAPVVQQLQQQIDDETSTSSTSTSSAGDFLRTFEGAVLQLPGVNVSHISAFEAAVDDENNELQYLVRITCSRGAVKPSSFAVGQNLSVTLPSTTVTLMTGKLLDINRALSSIRYFAPLRYRGVDDVEIAARVAGLGFSGGWGSTKVYVFVDGVNDPPALSAPRLVRSKGAVPTTVGGISVADDDTMGIMTVTAEAARGLVSLPLAHRLQLLEGSEVRQPRDIRDLFRRSFELPCPKVT